MNERNDVAVSPVVAVILLVAVTVTLSAVIGGFALNLGQEATNSGTTQEIGVQTSHTTGTFTATVVTGTADEVEVLVNGVEKANITNPSAGDVASVNATSGDSVTVVVVSDGSEQVASSTTVSTSSSSTTVSAPSDGLVSRWTLDTSDLDGTTVIDVAGSQNGTNHNATFDQPGIDGEAAQFDGSSSYLDMGSGVTNYNSDFTVAFWARSLDTSHHVVDERTSGYSGFSFKTLSDDTMSFFIGDGTNTTTIRGGNVTTGNWQLYVGVWNESTGVMQLYANDTLVAETTTTDIDNSSASNDFFVGAKSGGSGTPSDYVAGYIDDVRVYNRSLNGSEVGDLYDATK